MTDSMLYTTEKIMKAFITLLAVGLAFLFLFSSEAYAVPGDVSWTVRGEVKANAVVNVNQTALITFAAGSNDSKVLIVTSRVAAVCFLPDTAAAGGAARITLYRALTSPPSDTARITVPALTFDGTDCDSIVNGTYWFEIGTAAAGIETPIITVTGG